MTSTENARLILVLALAVVCGAFGGISTIDRTTLVSGTHMSSRVLNGGVLYEVQGNATITAAKAVPTLVVDDTLLHQPAVVYVPAGCSLTVVGGGNAGKTGGQAAIELVTGRKLIICGEGGVNVTGGAAGDAADGSPGGDAEKDGRDCWAGNGGAGGAGGGGSGAGIGGGGGAGGDGGSAVTGYYSGDYYPVYNGYSGASGSWGNPGGSMGELYVLGRVTVIARGGAASENAGSGGAQGRSIDDDYAWSSAQDYGVGGGGGGGGGGLGSAARYGIGGGGGGGGGGGSGGSGAIDYNQATIFNEDVYGAAGQGGSGGYPGGGGGNPSSRGYSDIHKVYGGWGGDGGGVGGEGGHGTLYVSSRSTVLCGRSAAGTVDALDELRYRVKLDNGGSTSYTFGCLSMDFENTSVPTRSNCVFYGYYTEPFGEGVMTHDSQGRATGAGTLRTVGDDTTTLYAHWKDMSGSFKEFVVTTAEDPATFVYSDDVVSLREAIAYLMEHPYAVNEAGRRTILFSDELVAAAHGSLTLELRRPIGVDQFIGDVSVEGSAAMRLRMEASFTDIMFKFTGNVGNRFVFRNITFHNVRCDDAAGGTVTSVAQVSGAGTAVFENCCFKDNGGRPIFVDMQGQGVFRRCSFVREASSPIGGEVLVKDSGRITASGCTFSQIDGVAVAFIGRTDEPNPGAESSRIENCTFRGLESGIACAGYAAVFTNLANCAFLNMEPASAVKPPRGQLDDGGNVVTRDEEALEGGTARTIDVAGVDQTYFPIRRLGPLDGAGMKITGLDVDIRGSAIPDPSDGVFWCAAGSYDPGWERPRCRVSGIEDVDDPSDGRVSISEALRYARDAAINRDEDGWATVTFGDEVFGSASTGILVFDCRSQVEVGPFDATRRIRVLGPETGCGVTLRPATNTMPHGWIRLSGGETELVLANLAFDDGTNAVPAGAIHSFLRVEGARLLASNCAFRASAIASSVQGDDHGTMTFVGCTFDGESRAFDSISPWQPLMLVDSTVRSPLGVEYSGENLFLVQSTLGRRGEGQTLPAGTHVHGCCVFETGTATAAEATPVRVGTVGQLAFEPKRPGPLTDGGYFVYHDATWTNVAVARVRGGARVGVLGAPELATELLDVDIAGERTRAHRNVAGSRTMVSPEANPLVVDTLEDDWDPLDPDGCNDVDGRITLRDCLLAASENSALVNANGERVVVFADGLLPPDGLPLDVHLTNAVVVASNGTSQARLTVQGWTNRLVRVRGYGEHRFLEVSGLVDLHFRDLMFMDFGSDGEDGGLVRVDRPGHALFENTHALNCRGDRGGVVFCSSGGMVTFLDSTISECRAVEGGFAYQDGAGGVCLVYSTVLQTSASSAGSLLAVSGSGGTPVFLQSTYKFPPGGANAFAGVGDWRPTGCVVWDNATGEAVPRIMDDAVSANYTTSYVRGVPHCTFTPLKFGSADGQGGQVYHSADWQTIQTTSGTGLVRKDADQIGNPVSDDAAFNPSAGAVCQSWEAASLSVTRADYEVDDSDGETSLPEALEAARSCHALLGADGRMTIDFDRLQGSRTIDAGRTLQMANMPHPIVLRGPESGDGVVFERVGCPSPVLESWADLELRNLTFRDAEGDVPAEPLVAAWENTSLIVSNCCFVASGGEYGNGIRALKATGRVLAVAQSSFDVRGRALADNSRVGVVVESTVIESEPSQFNRTVLVADTFPNGAPEQPSGVATANDVCCVFGREMLLTGSDGVVQTNRAGSVDQFYFRSDQPGAFAGTGCFVWHDAAWTNVAWSVTTNGARTELVGRALAASDRFDRDVRGVAITADHNSLGSYACPYDNLVDCVNTTRDDSGEPNNADGILSLREALNLIHRDGLDAEGRTVTFDESIFTDGMATIAPTGGEFNVVTRATVKGPSNRTLTIDARKGSRHFLVQNGGRRAAFENLVLVNGKSSTAGGSVRIEGSESEVSFSDCVFEDNESRTSEVGGAIFAKGPLAISGSTFRRNHADGNNGSDGGGAVWARGSSLLVTNCLFEQNSSKFAGGAVCARFSSTETKVLDCVFRDNLSEHAAGALEAGGRLVLRDSVFENNRSTGGDGGGAVWAEESARVDNCSFSGNSAASAGGALRLKGVKLVANCSFLGNRSGSGKNGGALHSEQNATVVNCSFLGNSSGNDGGGFFAGESARNLLVNCTFRGNSAATHGGGIAVSDDGTLVLRNVISLDNDAQAGASGPSADFYVWAAATVARDFAGVVMAKGPGLAQNAGLDDWSSSSYAAGGRVFETEKNAIGTTKVQVGRVVHPVERLKQSAYIENKALTGVWVKHDAAWDNVVCATTSTGAYSVVVGDASSATTSATDITGRTFTPAISQMGCYWRQKDNPLSLEVNTLLDAEDDYDGQISLRDVVVGIASGDARYRALKGSDGVYHVTFAEGLGEGTILMDNVQWVVSADAPVEIDGDGRITVDGTFYKTSEKFGVTCVETNSHRAFLVQRGCELRVRNMTFADNVGVRMGTAPTTGDDGGAILNWGSLVAENCMFLRCSAGTGFLNPVGCGGGVCNGAPDIRNATATLRDCTFRECRAARGGAVYNYAGGTVVIEDGFFESNRAGEGTAVMTPVGGALCNADGGTLSYTGSSFADNTVSLDGVTLWNDSADLGLWYRSYVTVSVENGEMAVVLNELAKPDLAGPGAVVELAVAGDTVYLLPSNVKPGLHYAVGYTFTLGTPFTIGPWVRADAAGNLPGPLTAPKGPGRGFYRVYVCIDPGT